MVPLMPVPGWGRGEKAHLAARSVAAHGVMNQAPARVAVATGAGAAGAGAAKDGAMAAKVAARAGAGCSARVNCGSCCLR